MLPYVHIQPIALLIGPGSWQNPIRDRVKVPNC